MKTRKGLIHCIAVCSDCEERWEDWRTARDCAYQHAKRKGHKVMVEVGNSIVYDGRATGKET